MIRRWLANRRTRGPWTARRRMLTDKQEIIVANRLLDVPGVTCVEIEVVVKVTASQTRIIHKVSDNMELGCKLYDAERELAARFPLVHFDFSTKLERKSGGPAHA